MSPETRHNRVLPILVIALAAGALVTVGRRDFARFLHSISTDSNQPMAVCKIETAYRLPSGFSKKTIDSIAKALKVKPEQVWNGTLVDVQCNADLSTRDVDNGLPITAEQTDLGYENKCYTTDALPPTDPNVQGDKTDVVEAFCPAPAGSSSTQSQPV